MKRDEVLAQRFEAARHRLLRIALRILGSTTEAEDALQERLHSASQVTGSRKST